MTIAAPVIEAEMGDWVAKGGSNSGIVGNDLHDYGFHLGANKINQDDYSRWRDPNGADGPYVNWDYACAGDFSHNNDERLRAMHRTVLARLMHGELPMICEFIGQPWADQPVYYWARWNGNTTLQRYTGSGHDIWSHISWYRSTVDQRAYLWIESPTSSIPSSGKKKLMVPPVILQPASGGIVLAWPSDVARAWVWTNIRPPGAEDVGAPELVDKFLAAGCVDGRFWGVKDLSGYINLASIPQASIALGEVTAKIGPMNLVLAEAKGTLTPKV